MALQVMTALGMGGRMGGQQDGMGGHQGGMGGPVGGMGGQQGSMGGPVGDMGGQQGGMCGNVGGWHVGPAGSQQGGTPIGGQGKQITSRPQRVLSKAYPAMGSLVLYVRHLQCLLFGWLLLATCFYGLHTCMHMVCLRLS